MMESLRRLVETRGATALPGVSIRLDLLRPMLSRAVARRISVKAAKSDTESCWSCQPRAVR